MIGKALLSLALASSAMGSLLTAPLVIPDLFQQLGAPADDKPVTFTLHLNSPNYHGLLERTQAIASNRSAWLQVEELEQYMRPSAADSDAVKQYLSAQGIPDSAIKVSRFGEDVKVTTTVAQAKKVFPNTEFNLFDYLSNQVVRTKKLNIPAPIANAVFHVGGLVDFPRVKRLAPVNLESLKESLLAKRADATDCNASRVTPSCLRHYYGTYDYQPQPSEGTDITVMGYIGQYVSQADLTTFLQRYRPDAADYQIPIVLAAGGTNDENNPGVEAMLDVETVVGHAYPLKTNFVSYSDAEDPNDIFAETFDYFISGDGASDRPGVISISYGSEERDLTQQQAESMCQKATQLSALGTTIVVASGDAGVSGNGAICNGGSSSPFIPTYPGGCPAILSVGATTGFNPEVMVSRFQSGAGRSNYFDIPDYQAAQVAAYDPQLSSTQTPPGSYNTNGRAFPDLSASGDKYVVVENGQEVIVGGTSAATPTIAAVFGLLNNALKAAGQPLVGYAQPKIYPATDGFNDITSGGSYGCGRSKNLGFPAKQGWDGSSGLGTPKFAELRQALGA